MIQTSQDLHVDEASLMMLDKAKREGLMPRAWMWGPDVRAAHSAFMDSDEAKAIMVYHPSLKMPDDGRICEYAGLPAYPMVAEGIALRTVVEQESGFD